MGVNLNEVHDGSCLEEPLGKCALRSVMPQVSRLVSFEDVLAPALPKSSGPTNEERCVSAQHGKVEMMFLLQI